VRARFGPEIEGIELTNLFSEGPEADDLAEKYFKDVAGNSLKGLLLVRKVRSA
jgi:hypothetical protein